LTSGVASAWSTLLVEDASAGVEPCQLKKIPGFSGATLVTSGFSFGGIPGGNAKAADATNARHKLNAIVLFMISKSKRLRVSKWKVPDKSALFLAN
jgi:hypothetical protein